MGESNLNLLSNHSQLPSQKDIKEATPYIFEDVVGNGLQTVDRLLRENKLKDAENKLLEIQNELNNIKTLLNKRQKKFKDNLDRVLSQTDSITQKNINELMSSYEKAKTDKINSRSFLG